MSDNPTKELLVALSEFQKTNLAAHKDSTAGRYKYASEKSINDAIRAAKHMGLAHVFTMKPCGFTEEGIGQTEVSLRVFHAESGGFIQSSMLVADFDPNNKRDIRHQQRGGGITYAKRYLLAAAFGIGADENQGECTADEIDAEAKELAKPKAKSNPPKQAKSVAKPAVDPLVQRREAALGEIKRLHSTDSGVYPLWCQELKDRFKDSDHPITADKPSHANLTCEEHVAFTEDFVRRLTKAAAPATNGTK